MKTPEEIKKGLECCTIGDGCKECPYNHDGCGDNEEMTDALAYIQQLEDGIDRIYEQAKGLSSQIGQLEKQLATPYKQATMKEVAECLKSMGIDCCYEGNEHD